ncbi:capsule assembly Wzi family protein [Gramella sp. AN32]|uniref:Capsule assembly Wzi family protein n=1 Tax=Christiangramia antarctica TaxID=2058158 RepID=A0ABW5XBZ2_9FLAO|nr:capsule assembly Wzi family protein [Gramella sp. AN32]MCM4155360.1 hypothetical protein [Gramella sp. AN32]
MKKKRLLLIIFFVSFKFGFAQNDFSGSISLNGFYANQDDLPFWFYHNQNGQISVGSSFAGLTSLEFSRDLTRNLDIKIGGGLFYDDYKSHFRASELFWEINYRRLKFVIGKKQRPLYYDGLSATNENFAWSNNSQALPGLKLSLNEPLNIFPKLALDFSWAEYIIDDNKYKKYPKLHHKSFHLIYSEENKFSIRAGIQHYAQWGGKSKSLINQPEGLKDYLKVVFGREGGENANLADQQNVLGNHLGVYELNLNYLTSGLDLGFIYNHFFEDGSGSRFANFPDGRYGIFVKSRRAGTFFQSVIYEFYHTLDQSKSAKIHNFDNYFNSGPYQSAWAYQKRIIGLPFFKYDEGQDLVFASKFQAHHAGFNGLLKTSYKNLPFKFMLSRINYKSDPTAKAGEISRNTYLYFDISLSEFGLDFKPIFGAEYSTLAKPIYGTGLQVIKSF